MERKNGTIYFIETGYGDSYDNIDSKLIDKLILDLSKMDDEHGVFWIADEDDNVLEINNDKSLFFNLPAVSIAGNCKILIDETLKKLFNLFQDSNFVELKNELKKINDISFKSI